MFTVFGAPNSAFVRKVLITLKEKLLPYKLNPVSPLDEYLPKEFTERSPLGKIPILKHNDFYLADSSVICAYLEKLHPKESQVYPSDPQDYANTLWFEEWADTKLFSTLAPFYYQTVLVPLFRSQQPSLEKIEAANENLSSDFSYLETYLQDKQYLVNEQFSIADIAVTSVFMNMAFSGFPLDENHYPILYKYLERMFSRPTFAEDIPALQAQYQESLEAVATMT